MFRFSRPQGHPRSRGFTLVELLVVIGIIALLISILLPTLSQARKSAKALKCGAGMRSIGQASVLFANDKNGRLPYNQLEPRSEANDGFWWMANMYGRDFVSLVDSYEIPVELFICPEAEGARSGTAFDWQPLYIIRADAGTFWETSDGNPPPNPGGYDLYNPYNSGNEADWPTYEEARDIWEFLPDRPTPGQWPIQGNFADIGSYHTMFGVNRAGGDRVNEHPYEVVKLIDKTQVGLGEDANPAMMADRLMWQDQGDGIKMLFNHGDRWTVSEFELFGRDYSGRNEGTQGYNPSGGEVITNMRILSQQGNPRANVLYVDGHVDYKSPESESYHGKPNNPAYFFY